MRTLLLLISLSLAASAPALGSPDDGVELLAKKPKKPKKAKKGQEEPAPTPPPDGDGDGIPDGDDKCPAEAEDQDLHEDADGCPDPDNDGDGIVDADDGCPFEAENVDGWDDADGCPEAPPTMTPVKVEATLADGTKIGGTIVRIVAIDEDEAESEPSEPAQFEVSVGDSEYPTAWSNLRGMTSEDVKFTEAVDCYSEGVLDLGDERPMWECTLKQPTKVKLEKYEAKGTHYFLDRKMRRLDLKIDGMTCEGEGCEALLESRTLSIYPYKIITMEKNDDETAAVTALQTTLRAVQKRQIKKATFTPVEPPADK